MERSGLAIGPSLHLSYCQPYRTSKCFYQYTCVKTKLNMEILYSIFVLLYVFCSSLVQYAILKSLLVHFLWNLDLIHIAISTLIYLNYQTGYWWNKGIYNRISMTCSITLCKILLSYPYYPYGLLYSIYHLYNIMHMVHIYIYAYTLLFFLILLSYRYI